MTPETKIEWTDFTVNFWIGCQKVGPGCDNCYAEGFNNRYHAGANWGPGAPRRKVEGAGIPKLQKINRGAQKYHDAHGRWPRIFVSSHSDIFDNAVSSVWQSDAFEAITAATDTRIQLLTKRVGNVESMVPTHWRSHGWPSHVGLMITVVNQDEADRDIPKLLDLKARFGIPWVGLSIEPMLGAIHISNWLHDSDCITTEHYAGRPACLCRETGGPHEATIDWVICGGESGSKARPMHPDWARSLRDQCAAADVPFHFKQWGEWWPISQMDEADYRPLYRPNRKAKAHEDQDVVNDMCGETCTVPTSCLQLDGQHKDPLDVGAWGHGAMLALKVGKEKAGRLLDGVTHDGVPS